MATTERPVKLTVLLDDRNLYRALRHAAVQRDQSLRHIVAEALQEWIERQEEREDLAAMVEVESDEMIPWEEAKASLEGEWARRDAR